MVETKYLKFLFIKIVKNAFVWFYYASISNTNKRHLFSKLSLIIDI